MSASIVTLIDDKENDMFPTSMGEVVGKTTTFDTDGSVTTTFENGYKTTTRFLDSGDIEETMIAPNGRTIYTKKTSFDADGTIKTTIGE